MKKLIIILLTVMTISAYGQSTIEQAQALAEKAISEMESGNIAESIKLLEEAVKLEPENINYPYEIAYAQYLDKKYDKSIEILLKLKTHEKFNPRMYQMLGNCYDMSGDKDLAIATYDEGLTKFPASGRLYLERANMELFEENYQKALGFYEKGIKVDPKFPSNYYWVAKLYFSSTEKVWGMIYAEIFINLERGSKRTMEISKMLYDVSKSQIVFTSDSSMSVSFSRNTVINIDDLADTTKNVLPFGIGIYEPCLIMSLLSENSFDLEALVRIRINFIELYFKKDYNKTYPNILFDYQKQIADSGYAQAYHHWLLVKGDEDAANKWIDENEAEWIAFIDWFKNNPIEITEFKNFHRTQY